MSAQGEPPSVFVSYARADDEDFARWLRDGLHDAGVRVWFDRDSLPSRGQTFVQEIRDAIAAHDRVVLVVGAAALQSTYVQAEWRHALQTGKVVVPVSVRPPQESRSELPRELRRLEVVDARSGRSDAVLAKVLDHLRAPQVLPGPALHVPPPPPHYQEREADCAAVEAALGLDSAERLTANARRRTLVLHGMGGVGKSVTAAAVARDVQVRRRFPAGVVWVELGRGADVLAGLRRVGALLAEDLRDYSDVEQSIRRLTQRIAAEPLLIVADNAWSDAELAPFAAIMGPATGLLVTTRDGAIATRHGAEAIAVEPLSDDEALERLASWVGVEAEALPAAARVVAGECGGLPLALSLVGAMARDGTPWEDVAEAIAEADLGFIATQLPDYPFPDLLRALQVSVDALAQSEDELERTAATCFVQLAALRWDRAVPEAALVTLWSQRCGLRPRTARRVLSLLVSKALLRAEGEAPRRNLTLHDLLHDFACASVDDLVAEHGALLDAFAAAYPGAPFVADDGYYLDHVVHHLREAGRGASLPALLDQQTADGENGWWATRLRHGQVSGYVEDVRRAFDDASRAEDAVAVVRRALMIASARSAIGEVPAQLATIFLEHGIWTAPQALAAADWAEGRGSRFAMLVAALPFVGEVQRDSVAEEAALLARQEPEDPDRVRRLVELAQALRAPDGRRFVTEAFPRGQPAVGDPQSMIAAWGLDPQRTELVDAALDVAEARLEYGVMTAAWLASEVPEVHVPRMRRLVAQLTAPDDRLELLLALIERADGLREELVEQAERELAELQRAEDIERAEVGMVRVQRAIWLRARMTPFLAQPDRGASALAVASGCGELEARRRGEALLSVVLELPAGERATASRDLRTRFERADPDLVELLTDKPAGRRLRDGDPTLFAALAEIALSAAQGSDSPWTRATSLAALLAHVPPDRARAAAAAEARAILEIDDMSERCACVAAYAARLDADAAACSAGSSIKRMTGRLALADVAKHVAPLLAFAAPEDVAAVERACRRALVHWPLELRPALFAAFGRLGDWDAALDALDGASALELRGALERAADVPAAFAEEIVAFAIERAEPELFGAAIVALAERLDEELLPRMYELALEAVDAIGNAYERLRLIEGLAAVLPAGELASLADRVVYGGDRLAHDRARTALARGWIGAGDSGAALDQIVEMKVAETKAEAMLELADGAVPQLREELLACVEQTARRVHWTHRAELLVGVAQRCEEPRRAQLMTEATAVAENPPADAWSIDSQADVLRVVAEAHAGAERERLLLAAWDAAARGGSFSGVGDLERLGPLLAQLPAQAIRARWERALARASASRPALLQELTALSDVVIALGGPTAAAEIVEALDDADRWWP